MFKRTKIVNFGNRIVGIALFLAIFLISNNVFAGGNTSSPSNPCPSGITPQYSCPTGFTASSANTYCYKPATCKRGTFDASQHGCIFDASSTSPKCPPGSAYLPDINKCGENVYCPPGSAYEPNSNQCWATITPMCKAKGDINPNGLPGYEGLVCMIDFNKNGNLDVNNGELAACTINQCPPNYSLSIDGTKCEAAPLNTTNHTCPVSNSTSIACTPDTVHRCSSIYDKQEVLYIKPWNTATIIRKSNPECTISLGLAGSLPKHTVILDPCINKADIVGKYNTATKKCEIKPTDPSDVICPLDKMQCTTTQSTPICPKKGSLNTTTHKCQATPINKCPSGYIYDAVSDMCKATVKCPNGGSLNPSTDLCEVIISTSSCPSGYSYDLTLKMCIKKITCPNGGAYNSTTNKCQITPGNSCPSGYTYNNSSNLCLKTPTCPTGSTYSSIAKKCIVPVSLSCPGAVQTSTGAISCTANTVHRCSDTNNHQEVLYNQPWTPYSPIIREPNPECTTALGAADRLPVHTVIPDPCGSNSNGYVLEGSLCIANPTCPLGMYYNSTTKRCEQTPSGGGTTRGSCYASNGTLACSPNTVHRCSDTYDHQEVLYNGPWSPSVTVYRATNYSCTTAMGLTGQTPPYWVIPDPCSTYMCSITGSRTYSSWTQCFSNCIKTNPPYCQTGQLVGTLCVANPICASGGSFNYATGNCQLPANISSCPSGFSYDSAVSACAINPPCPSNGSFNSYLGECTISSAPTCPTGYTYNSTSHTCQSSPPTCQYGSFNSTRDECEISAAMLCPFGYTFDSADNKCTLAPTCPTGSNYSKTYDGCMIDAIHCPTDYSYTKATKLCEAVPICPNGLFIPSTNQCNDGNNTCPYNTPTKTYKCVSNADGHKYCSKTKCIDASSSSGTTINADDRTYHNDGARDAKGNCLGQIYIFNGQGMQCRHRPLANCCKTPSALKHQGKNYLAGALGGGMAGYGIGGMITTGVTTTYVGIAGLPAISSISTAAIPGIGVGALVGVAINYLSSCGKNDIITDVNRDNKVCHYVGTYCSHKLGFICLTHSDSYCCFRSLLARIVQEQGRPQLKDFGYSGDWGQPEAPNCRGFTPSEFQLLDFDKIDLSEWIGDLEKTLQAKASEIQSNVTNTITNKTQTFYQNTMNAK